MLKNSQFHHIGYAVKDITKTAAHYVEAGYVLSNVIYDPVQQTNIAFLTKSGCPKIELVEGVEQTKTNNVSNTPPYVRNSNSSKGVVYNIMQKVGVTPYHICYEVESLEDAILELRTQRFLQLFKPVEAIALDNKRICYLMHPDVGLIELVER